MTIITSTTLADMHARRLTGESVADIARSYGIKETAVYQRLRRQYGLEIYRQVPPAANDNYPDRVTRTSYRNGGCSTLSGAMPVSVARVPCIDGPAPLQVAA